MSDTLNIYDSINTLAVKWLVWNEKTRKQSIGIKKFNYRNISHMWLLKIFETYSISQGYKDFYLDCSLTDYCWIKFVKKIKHIKRTTGNEFLIEPELFIKEICDSFNKDSSIVEEIYNTYWSE